ncbi:EXS-domain-containing protein [Laetiporus sulphureus 93-53]|uniref:EXS-domain-containing protein n=1 Tax=Laetiporus sulphureus 93-53 TaxID=1314785 RepID=A0A165DC75_9APHY|nr:EXS-domain-containing protein [Laetiporus sulphureus 93-53]KZT04539.1 EXS-domain-containing protein [Laetiporus sulphureus 93-53]
MHAVSPSDWPLLWLAWALFIWLNPLPIFFRSSRYWLLKNLYRQLTSGVRRVEFQDFWMGDQFCSLVFTLGDLWFVGCAYSHALKNWRICTTGANWAPMFAIAVLPFFVRFVQSIRRWADSKQLMHLVNAGKYGTGIIYYLTYYLWRQHGGGRGPRFVAWCILGVFYAGYAGAWDILMDWSLMQRHAKYRFLRSELIYTSHVPLYYVAIVANIIIRYEFLMYIPEKGVNYVIRTFIAAMLEMLRRWQWNFLRLENEHIGNMDQYRVTREVPLPYSFDHQSHDSDGGDEDDEVERTSISTRSWRRRKVNTPSVGAVEVEDNHEQ